MALNIVEFLVSWAIVPLVDSKAAWMWRMDVEGIASDVLNWKLCYQAGSGKRKVVAFLAEFLLAIAKLKKK